MPWTFRSKYPCWKCILGQLGYIHLTSAEICSFITVNLESPLGGSRITLHSTSPFPSSLKHSNKKNKISSCSDSGKKMIVFLCKFYIQLLSSEQKGKKKEMHISWRKTVRCVKQCLSTHLPHQELKVWRNPLRQAAWWSLTDCCLSSQVRSPLL